MDNALSTISEQAPTLYQLLDMNTWKETFSPACLTRTPRIRRLSKEFMQRLLEKENGFMNRILLMAFAHEVDFLKNSYTKKLEKGKSRLTAAFQIYAAEIYDTHTGPEATESEKLLFVRETYKRSQDYYQVLEEGGPGSLVKLEKIHARTL